MSGRVFRGSVYAHTAQDGTLTFFGPAATDEIWSNLHRYSVKCHHDHASLRTAA